MRDLILRWLGLDRLVLPGAAERIAGLEDTVRAHNLSLGNIATRVVALEEASAGPTDSARPAPAADTPAA